MVGLDRIEYGIATFLDRELLPRLPFDSGKKTLVAAGAAVLMKGYLKKMQAALGSETVKMAGLTDENGNINVEAIREELIQKTPDNGMQFHANIPFLGPLDLTIHKSDVEKIYQYITGG